MNGDQFRKLALSLPDASEAPHFDRAAFRTPKRIFATLSADERSVNFKLEPDQQAALVESRSGAFEAIAGGWGRQGWTTMTLAKVSVAEARSVLADAHALASIERRPRAKAKRATKRKR
jgi:predicted DNA-binding protein (MmcQ/YjbR family)